MKLARDPQSLAHALAPARRRGAPIGFVPTMGALHEGHQALVQECRNASDFSVVSIFVNPIQFETSDAFRKYPRNPKRDLSVLRSMNVDVAYCPGADVYPADTLVRVTETTVSRLFEGAVRPGHFDGVLTIVAKLFMHVRPSMAFFGEKDFQQIWLIRRMVSEFPFDVRIIGVPTVRDHRTGLACSSRNAFLSGSGRRKAASLNRAMSDALDRAPKLRTADAIALSVVRKLRADGVRVRYAVIVREGDFARVRDRLALNTPYRILAAVTVDGVHLIDNFPLILSPSA